MQTTFMTGTENKTVYQSPGIATARHLLARKICSRQGFILLSGLFFVSPAHAYLDPGTGSIVLQSLLAGIATVAALGSIFWQRLKAFFVSLFSARKPVDTDSETGADK